MALGRFTKTQAERKRYSIDYTAWLDSGETITAVEFVVHAPPTAPQPGSPLQVDAFQINAQQTGVVFFVSFGDNNITYTVDVRITTNGGQTDEDVVIFAVRNPQGT